MQVKVALANGKARSHKAPKRAPSSRELSSEARLKEYPRAKRDDSFRHAFGVPPPSKREVMERFRRWVGRKTEG